MPPSVEAFIEDYIHMITKYIGLVWGYEIYNKWLQGHQRRTLDLRTLPYLQFELRALLRGRKPRVGARVLNNGALTSR